MLGKLERRNLLIMAAAIILILLIIPVGAISLTASEDGDTSIQVEEFEAEILSVNNSTITVLKGDEELELYARGKWLLITSQLMNASCWAKVRDYVNEGDALVTIARIDSENQTANILLALKQDETTLIRLKFLKHHVKRYRNTGTYMSVKGSIIEKAGNYFLIDRNGNKAIVAVNGKWRKAGGGEVTWSDVSDEFRIGDEVRIFCHNILVMDEEFSEKFGINAFIWGYSGAIIDLTSGTTISKV